MTKEIYLENFKISKKNDGKIHISFERVNSIDYINKIDKVAIYNFDNNLVLSYYTNGKIEKRIVLEKINEKILKLINKQKVIGVFEFDEEVPILYYIS